MPDSPDVIPLPARHRLESGEFHANGTLRLWSAPGLQSAARALAEQLERYGVRCAQDGAQDRAQVRIELTRDASALGSEGYRLAVGRDAIRIEAAGPAGAFYAVQTIRQLLPSLPCMTVEDWPRFSWRGLHLDVVRHFFDVDTVKRTIDLMALLKLNRFHWHLTDDQGWRIQIDRYGLLTERSAWRTEEGGRRYGGFYTKEQVREVVAYAASRSVEVIPEIEMPGHARAILASYPELSCTGEPVEVWTTWGISKEVLCAGKEETFAFLEGVLDEVMELFPSEYVHVGGDECPKEHWRACARCQARMRSEKLDTEHELQSYFIRRVERYLNAHGKRLIGWDEILEGGLAPNATVMSWRGTEGGIEASRSGHDVVMCPQTHCYLDHKQSNNPIELRPTHFDPSVVTLEQIYSFDPVPASLTEAEAKHVIGGQADVWTEAIDTRDRLDYMMFPRLSALAEAVWSPSEERDWGSFKTRLRGHARKLAELGVFYCHVVESI